MSQRRKLKKDEDETASTAAFDFDKEVKQMHKLLDRIPDAFKQEDFNPLTHVINIMKAEDMQKRKKQLEADCAAIEKAMETIVAAHYEGFNKAITNYTTILNEVSTSKKDIQQSLEYHYMIEILDKVEFIKQVPEKFHQHLQEGNFLAAAQLLVKASDMLAQEDLDVINALIDRKREIRSLRQSFHETIIDVLHAYLYLNFETPERVGDDVKRSSTMRPKIEKKSGVKDYGEEQNKQIMRQLVESLAVLQQMKEGTTALIKRIRPELRQIIQKAVNEVKFNESEESQANSLNKKTDGESMTGDNGNNLFVRVLNNVFEKCKLIMSNHHTVCMAFEKFQQPPKHRLKAILEGGGQRTYNVENVWEECQKELLALIAYYIGAPMDSDVKKISNPTQTTTKLFSFSASSAFSTPEEGEADVSYEDMELGVPSPYNLPPLYPLISSFVESITTNVLVGASQAASQSEDSQRPNIQSSQQLLKKSIDNYIKKTFLDHIKEDYKKRAMTVAEEMFSIKDTTRSTYPASDYRRLRLGNVIEVYKCIRELYQDIIYMPAYTDQFSEIMEMILATFYDTCLNKFEDIIRGTETGCLVKLPDAWNAALADPHWHRMQKALRQSSGDIQAENAGTDPRRSADSIKLNLSDVLDTVDHTNSAQVSYEYELNHFKGLTLSGQPLTKKVLIVEKSKLIQLAMLHENISWLAEKLDHLGDTKKSAPVPRQHSRLQASTGAGLFSSPSRGNTPARPTHRRQGSNVPQQPVLKISSTLEMAPKLKHLADQCLVAIRMEMRLLYFYHLASSRRSAHANEQEPKVSDTSAVELNTELWEAYELLSAYLPLPKIRYVFGTLTKML